MRTAAACALGVLIVLSFWAARIAIIEATRPEPPQMNLRLR